MEDGESAYDMGRRVVREGRLPARHPSSRSAYVTLMQSATDDEMWQALLGALDEAATDDELWRLGDSFIPECIGSNPVLDRQLEELERTDERMQRVVHLTESWSYTQLPWRTGSPDPDDGPADR